MRLWDRTFPGTSGDDVSSLLLAESFKSAQAFRQAISDNIDEAVIDDGRLSCTVSENGEKVEAFVRDALRECLKLLEAGKKVRFWCGGDAVAPQIGLRERFFWRPTSTATAASCPGQVVRSQ